MTDFVNRVFDSFPYIANCTRCLTDQVHVMITITHWFSHGMTNRYLTVDEIRPGFVWKNVCEQVVLSSYGFVVFDDTVLDKEY